jgi:hypothetical protein
MRQVELTQGELERNKADAEILSSTLVSLASEAGSADAEAKTGAARVGDLRNELAGHVTVVLAQLGQPGITETARGWPRVELPCAARNSVLGVDVRVCTSRLIARGR